MTDLAIVIVSWNVRRLLAACLDSLQADLARSDLAAQVWVVDNASTDGSAEMVAQNFPQVRLIASSQNLGFAGGNNAALRAMGFGPDGPPSAEERPQAVLLLNPETEVHPGALSALYHFLQGHPQAGIAGARLVYADGRFQHSAFAFPGLWQVAIELLPLPGRLVESRLNGRYPRTLYQAGQPFEIGHPLGAAMCVRAEAIAQVGLLDERYHMYAEEMDWSKRITAAGWRAYCVPAATITHLGGQSTGQVKLDSLLNLWTSRYQFYRRHYHPLKVWLTGLIIRLGMRRQAARDSADSGLPPAELARRLACYRRIGQLWSGQSGLEED